MTSLLEYDVIWKALMLCLLEYYVMRSLLESSDGALWNVMWKALE